MLMKSLLVLITASAALACQNFGKLQQCMKSNLYNSTGLDIVKKCAYNSGCVSKTNTTTALKPKEENIAQEVMKFLMKLVNWDKLKECHNVVAPIVYDVVQQCVRRNITDFTMPKNTIGGVNSSFVTEVPNFNFTCGDAARGKFETCLKNNNIPKPMDSVCMAEEKCNNASIGNECTVDDVRDAVLNCAATDLANRGNNIVATGLKCMNASQLLARVFQPRYLTVIVAEMRKMGNMCDNYEVAKQSLSSTALKVADVLVLNNGTAKPLTTVKPVAVAVAENKILDMAKKLKSVFQNIMA